MSKNKVGYCNPPIESRFKKGHSGNIKGRPKGDKNINTLLKKEVNVFDYASEIMSALKKVF